VSKSAAPKETVVITKPSLIFIFALCFALFILVPPFLSQPFPANPSMHWADVLDLLTPLVLIPLYWLLFTDSGRTARSHLSTLVFLILASLWVEGQAMHLASNSIGNLLGEGSSAVHQLVHFYDEVLSHYLWHAGILALSLLLLIVAARTTMSQTRRGWGWVVPAGLLYGITCFLAFIEGATVPLGLPAVVFIVVGLIVLLRDRIRTHNLVGFFFTGYVVVLVLLAAWGIYWKGFPEPSALGLL
jgi:hypothetical protein